MNTFTLEKYKATTNFELKNCATHENFGQSKKVLKKQLKTVRKQLASFQNTLYAHNKYGVLICLQGMDTAGKDSLVREVFKSFNVRGVVVHSFKVPTSKELSHDYLWRHYIALPARGKFAVFNRTHYENVLVTKVHPEYLLAENNPQIQSVNQVNTDFWQERYRQINDFERHIQENGTIIFKFFLHLSKEEQRKRLLRRITLKEKNWKFSPSDIKERRLWNKYQTAYHEAISHTSTTFAPWYIIPADDKNAARLIVAQILLQALKKYKDIVAPELDAKIKANLSIFKKELQAESL